MAVIPRRNKKQRLCKIGGGGGEEANKGDFGGCANGELGEKLTQLRG